MLAKRIIPCLDVHAGRVVKGVNFLQLRHAGRRRFDQDSVRVLIEPDPNQRNRRPFRCPVCRGEVTDLWSVAGSQVDQPRVGADLSTLTVSLQYFDPQAADLTDVPNGKFEAVVTAENLVEMSESFNTRGLFDREGEPAPT